MINMGASGSGSGTMNMGGGNGIANMSGGSGGSGMMNMDSGGNAQGHSNGFEAQMQMSNTVAEDGGAGVGKVQRPPHDATFAEIAPLLTQQQKGLADSTTAQMLANTTKGQTEEQGSATTVGAAETE